MPDEPFVIKTNHDSGNVFLIHDKNKADYSAIREQIKHSMRHNFYHSSREWSYKNITPIILIEKLILSDTGDTLKDYKVMCFNGKPTYIQVESNRFSNHQSTTYNIDWEKQEFSLHYPSALGEQRPYHLNEMLAVAEKLAKPFPFVRIDFYDTNEKLYIGEITFHPSAGFGNFIPAEWDKKLGDILNLVKSKKY